MAVNRKGKGVNTIDPGEDFGLADLGRLEEQYANEPAAFREMRLRARNARNAINAIDAMENARPGSTQIDIFQEQLREAQRTKAKLEPRMALYKESARERVNAQAINVIGREYSERAINSYITNNQNSLENQVSGMNATWQGYGALAQQRTGILNQMQGLRQESMSAAGEYMQNRGVNPQAASTLQDNAGKMKDLANQLIPITLAMQQLKQQGLDPQGKQRSLINAGDKASGVLAYNALEDEMRSGKGLGSLSAGDLRKKEAESAEKLIKALDELRNSAGKTKDELEQLNKNAESAAQEFGDISEARRMGSPGGGDGYKAGAAWATAVGQLANLVGNTIQEMAINQPMKQMGNIAGYANLENQKYDSWKAGNEGNMTERMNVAGWANAGEFGRQMANRAGWVVGARIGGGLAGGAAGGLQLLDAVASAGQGTVGSKLGIKDATTVQQLTGGALAAGEGISTALIYGKDAIQKISTSQAEIAANAQAMQTTRALNHIPGYQLQQYRDHLMHLNKGAMGLGTYAGTFMDQAGSSAFLDRMTGVGLGGAEMGQLSQFGAANMGSMFSADQALMAKHYENMGWGSSQENMQRMAGFASAGSQNPMQSMEKVLERAVGTGINSSKALNIIAENTGQLVEQDNFRGSGFDTTDTISRLILGAVDRKNTNQEFATRQAAETFKSEEGFKTNTSNSFAGYVAIARMQKDLGMDYASSVAMQQTSPQMRAMWQQMAKDGKLDDVKLQMRNQGIDYASSELFKKDPNAFFSKDASGMVLSQLERGGTGWATAATQNYSKLRSWVNEDPASRVKIYTGEASDANAPEWVQKQLLAMNQAIKLENKDKDSLAVRRSMAVGEGWLTSGRANLPQEGMMRDDAFGFSQGEKSLGERQRNAAAQQGGEFLGGKGFSGTTGALAVAATGRAHQALPGGGAEAKWAEAAAKSASDFGVSAVKLDNASGRLVEAANKLIEFAGANKLSADDPELKKKVEQMERDAGFDKLPGDPKKTRLAGGQ